MGDAKMTIEVGGDLQSFAADVAGRWKAAEAGHAVEPSRKIVFRDWAALYATLTPKRMELMARLHAGSAEGIRPLARALDRDVKRVHSDVVALAALGLVSRNAEGAIALEHDEIQSTIRIDRGVRRAS